MLEQRDRPDASAPEAWEERALALLEPGGNDPARVVFLTRSLRALRRLAASATSEELGRAAQEPADVLVLLRGAETAAAMLDRDADLLAPARDRGRAAMVRLAQAEGGLATAAELGALLGPITRQAVDKRRKSGKLLALDFGSRGFRYPVWQADEGRVLPGIELVLSILREHDPWTQLAFLVGPSTWLGGETPLALMRRGQVEPVLRVAEMVAEQ